jgi:polyisoprenoid-binding protein YceI
MKASISRIAAVTGLILLLSLAASAATTTYKIDPQHSSAEFAVTHLMISKVRGEFHGVNGTIVVDDKDITRSTVDVTIDATSVDTREPNRDKHLKSPDFFDVANYPTITFKSTSVEQSAPGKLKVNGDLTIHGVTKPVVLEATVPTAPIKDPWQLQRSAVFATTTINRLDFGVKWNAPLEAGGVVVGDDVKITLDVEMIIPPPSK